jgi:heat shock protein HslJ
MTLAACQGASTNSKPSLVGTTWIMVSYRNSEGQTAQALVGSDANANFTSDGKVSGKATCNQYSGTYKTSRNKITIVPGAMTMMACPGEGLMAQEQDFIKALSDSASYILQSDQLILSDKDGNVVLTFTAQKASALSDSTWQAISYNNGNQAVVSIINGTEITAIFGSDGNLSGSAGCNNYNAAYTLVGNSITIGPAASTRKFCGEPAGLMEQETAYLKALEMAKTYEVSGSQLTLKGETGNIVIQYQTK